MGWGRRSALDDVFWTAVYNLEYVAHEVVKFTLISKAIDKTFWHQ